jgi:hypothetical protein
MRHDIELRLFELDTLHVWTRDPGRAVRTVSLGITTLLGREDDSLLDRARALAGRLQATPDYLEAWRPAGGEPSRPHVEQAIVQADALARLLREGVPSVASGLPDTALAGQLDRHTRAALEAVLDYRQDLAERVWPGALEAIALGPERFAAYLRRAEGISASLPGLRAMAEAELTRLDARFRAAAAIIDSLRPAREVMLAVSADHPPRERILEEVEAAVRVAREFTRRDESFPAVPAEGSVQVRPTPPHARWTHASLAVPGPFEPPGRSAFFYVTLPDDGAPTAEQDEQARFLNRPLIRNVTLHETWPGHYYHALVQASLPRPARRAAWGRGFAEGWAHYVEGLAVERGFRADDPAFLLATQQSALRRAGRMRVALGIHTEGWTVDRAARFFEHRCYLEPSLARREAERAVFDPLYLIYSLGRIEIESIRAEIARREGAAFDLARFHEALLELGSPPLALARRHLLGAPARTAHGLE